MQPDQDCTQNFVRARYNRSRVRRAPGGFPEVPLVFADSVDPAVQESFGIGPGCQAGDAIAVPPGRILDLAAQVNPVGPNLFSICDASFDDSLAAIAAALLEG